MAVVHLKTVTKNADGLVVAYGINEATVTRAGEYRTNATRRQTEVIVDLSTLPTVASGNKQIVSETSLIPNGAFIEQIDVFVTKETAGTNANLDLGLVDQDTSTEIDFNGLLAAADAFNGGTDLGSLTTYVLGTTEVGALVGTRLTNTGLITANAETADFTAGILKVTIFWSIPVTADV